MRKSRVLKKLRSNQPVLVTGLHFTSQSLYELTSLMGFDCIWMDLEHHATSVETADGLIRATRIGASDVIVRIAKGEFMRMGRLLESGAHGIMYPRCDNAEEAAEVVRWAKFAPQGQRGFDGASGDMPYCTMPMDAYVRQANEETFIVVQIEDPDALENVESIAAVKGVDVVFFGPADFSVLSGTPGNFDTPAIDDAVKRVAAASSAAGIHWGTPTFSPEHAKTLFDKGARFLSHSADIVMILQGFERMQSDFGALGFEFDNRLPVT